MRTLISKAAKLVQRDAIESARAELSAYAHVQRGVAVLRNNLFAHRNISMSHGDAFREAKIKADDLLCLISNGERIVNNLIQARDAASKVYFSDLPRADVAAILAALSRVGEDLLQEPRTLSLNSNF